MFFEYLVIEYEKQFEERLPIVLSPQRSTECNIRTDVHHENLDGNLQSKPEQKPATEHANETDDAGKAMATKPTSCHQEFRFGNP